MTFKRPSEDQKAEKKQNHKFGITLREHKNKEAIRFLAACCNKKKQELKIGRSIRSDWSAKGHVCKLDRGWYCFFAFRWCETEAMCNSDVRSGQQLIQGHASLEARWAKWGYMPTVRMLNKTERRGERVKSNHFQQALQFCTITGSALPLPHSHWHE